MTQDLPLSGLKILVAEDEPDQRDFLVSVLEDGGATVLTAQNGDDALDRTVAERPDVLTLDINMPGMDVGEVYERLRSDADLGQLKICIISGRPELRGVLFDRFDKKPDGFLDKPVRAEDLVEMMGTLRGGS